MESNACDFLYICDIDIAKLQDNEELMDWIRSDSVIYARSSKYFKITLKKLIQRKKPTKLGRDIVSAQS